MGVFATGLSVACYCQPQLFLGRGMHSGPENLKGKKLKKQQDRPCHAKAVLKSKQPKDQKSLTFNFKFNYDAPLYESSGASFDQYLEDEERVVKAIFPRKEKTQTHEKEWRIQMSDIKFLFLSMYLVVYVKLRCNSMSKDYPPHVPHDISKVLELEITRFELLGLPTEYSPGNINLSAKGTMYPERQGTQSWLRNRYDINLDYVVPPVLGLVPDNVLRSITESIVKTSMEDVALNAILLPDYDKYEKEKLKNVV